MVVQHNMSAINANRYFGMNNSKLSKSLEKLSSGYAINRAGDNAAGLAVSEKMRAQISGLTQAAKNAQDGISMVQTYEGALTETDSILQRMRSLAVQSANGSYDNSVDRNAIQKEFDQLNDELNQIADTDFNGVVVLNGGKMADGLEAVDGVFDYKNKASQLAAANAQKLADAQTAADEKIAEAQAAVTEAQDALTALGGEDITLNGAGEKWNTVDENAYDKTAADKLWTALGYTDASSINEVTVTFKYDGANWTVDSGTDNSGTTLTSAQLGEFTVGTPTDNGGFEVTAGTGGATVNAIFDATNLSVGDTITLVFTNSEATKTAPTNIGLKDDSFESSGTSTVADYAVSLGTAIDGQDDAMTADVKKALDGLDGLKFSVTGDGTDVTEVKITANGGTETTLDLTDGSAINGDLFAKYDATANKITIYDGTDDSGTVLAEITTKDGEDGTVKGQIQLDSYKYTDGAEPDVRAGSDKGKDAVAITAAKNTLKAAQEKLAAAQEARPQTIADLKDGVSKSDAYDQSTAKLTYSSEIALQVGARTKDLVNFTFSYDCDAMGELKADLNCTAEGLGTDKLSLATQEDANTAIDKIDNAINKVSMVRSTFGAIQNRLEHKIDNLNTTNENITAAESRIRDTNMAEEMMNFTKNQILSQASQSMLAQANQLPQGVLSLLQ